MTYIIHNSWHGGVPIYAWTEHVPVEHQAIHNLQNMSKLPIIFRNIALMPDGHVGRGSDTVGSVIVTQKAIIPAVVGVDIGCGMAYLQTDIKAENFPDKHKDLRHKIENAIPMGTPSEGNVNVGSHHEDIKTTTLESLVSEFTTKILSKYPSLHNRGQKIMKQAGTLGGGNHFIEITVDENGYIGVMLHSGSRGIGNAIGNLFINKAQEEAVKGNLDLPAKDLAYFTEHSEFYHDYCVAVKWAQDYAYYNRYLMMEKVLNCLMEFVKRPFRIMDKAVYCHHNYISWETHDGVDVTVTRKGAIRVRQGEMGIIPGSMGRKSFIVRGKGNREAFDSCSHGAGRVMSRGEAKRQITLEDHIQDTEGVECKKDLSVIDESPKAYKNIDDVMRSQEDLVEIVHTVKQIISVKG